MRIVGGRHKGTALSAPKSQAIRPTSDRTREAVFNILVHGSDMDIEGARVLDLFAGTGALGLEALSRGAAFALFVDEGAEARGLIRANIERLGQTGRTKVFRRDATKLGPLDRFQPFTLVFCDPPYGKGLGEKALASALGGGWLADGAVVVLEEDADAEIAVPDGFTEWDRRRYGDTVVVFLTASP
ncbi:MAG: 16S rRNA (guanine(966)-N(2))-methyltransferase RsmD [Rhodobiaceae bacterium]|nr:16S rRNA (guanine(966)-N(2))-methyltransferase RsmD [Rhodobiaceae bacterium]